MDTEEWSIQQIAKIAGTTSRTLRHYGDIGLLPPSSIGHNGYRYYDQRCARAAAADPAAARPRPRACRRSPRCSIARHPRKTP